jgi:hypothetical protein
LNIPRDLIIINEPTENLKQNVRVRIIHIYHSDLFLGLYSQIKISQFPYIRVGTFDIQISDRDQSFVGPAWRLVFGVFNLINIHIFYYFVNGRDVIISQHHACNKIAQEKHYLQAGRDFLPSEAVHGAPEVSL